MPKTIRGFLNGVAFGAVQTVPSVSAGTVAIILGFYFDLIKAVNRFREAPRESLRFLLPLFLGAAAGILSLSELMAFLLERHPFPTMLFFMGLILGIVPRVFLRILEGDPEPAPRESAPPEPAPPGPENRGPEALGPPARKPKRRGFGAKEAAFALVPFALLLAASRLRGGPPADPAEIVAGATLPFTLFVFFAGVLASAALVVPGASGSFVLLMLGLYHVVIHSVRSIRLFFADPSAELFLDILRVLGPLGLGIIVGGLSMLRLIERLLEKRRGPVYSVILGLMTASVAVMAMDPMVGAGGASAPAVVVGIAAFAVGGAAAFFLGKDRL